MMFFFISKGSRLLYWTLYKIINGVNRISEKKTNKSKVIPKKKKLYKDDYDVTIIHIIIVYIIIGNTY